MATSLDVLEAEAMKLAPAERARLLERLVVSLGSDRMVDDAWEQLADRRELELESGSVTAVPASEAITRLRARLPR